jgi:hypothetical protein
MYVYYLVQRPLVALPLNVRTTTAVTAAVTTAAREQAHRLAFVRRHLQELLQLVAAAGAGAAAAAAKSGAFSVARIELSSLGFLISGGHALDDAQGWDLADLCPAWAADDCTSTSSSSSSQQQQQQQAEQLQQQQLTAAARKQAQQALLQQQQQSTRRAAELCDWLAAALTVNEVLYPVPPSPAVALLTETHALEARSAEEEALQQQQQQSSPPPPPPSTAASGSKRSSSGGTKEGAADVGEKAAVAAGHLVLPEARGAPLLVNCALRTTVLYSEGTASASTSSSSSGSAAAGAAGSSSAAAAAAVHAATRDLQVNHCHESYVYVLAPFRHATVIG